MFLTIYYYATLIRKNETKNKRLKVKRLFILGAGASYSATASRAKVSNKQAPLDKDFTNRLLNLNVGKPYWVNQSRDIIQRFWKYHKPMTDFGLEQAIIIQIGHLEFVRAIQPWRRRKGAREFDYLNHLSHLICWVLRQTRESSTGIYNKFTTKVFSGQEADQVLDRIITFNYDDLLDMHLLQYFTAQQVYFDTIKDSRTQDSGRRRRFEHPVLVKLHGSVNWRCTSDEFAGIIGSNMPDKSVHRIESIWWKKQSACSPQDSEYPLMIPPLPVKPITRIQLFQFLWTKASEYLHEAEEIVVCGYSLPEVDRLAMSLFANFSNKNLKEITIVDPDPAMMTRWRDIFRRNNISTSAHWNYFPDFAEYVQTI